jgi:anti-sigma-K factor RskA
MSEVNGHPTREEEFDLYALGALEGDEKQTLEAHLAGCAACAEKLAQGRGRIALLALAAPAMQPSARVKERLMRQIHAEGGGVLSTRGRAGGGERSGGGAVARWWAMALAPAFVVAALAAIFLWSENTRLDRELVKLHTTMESQQQALDRERQMSELLRARNTMLVTLQAQPGTPQSSGRVLYNAELGKLMADTQMQPAPENKTYQLWLVPKQGAPISAGVFNASGDGHTAWIATMPKDVAALAFAVTIEPAGGMPHPTGPKVLVGPAT